MGKYIDSISLTVIQGSSHFSDISLFRQFTFPTSHFSDSSLFRQFTFPTVHFSDKNASPFYSDSPPFRHTGFLMYDPVFPVLKLFFFRGIFCATHLCGYFTQKNGQKFHYRKWSPCPKTYFKHNNKIHFFSSWLICATHLRDKYGQKFYDRKWSPCPKTYF